MKLVLLVLFASALLLLGCAGQPPGGAQNQQPAPPAEKTVPPAPEKTTPPASSASVEISGFAFSPAEITVAKGTTVTWTNRDSVAHTVTSGTFDSGSIASGASYSRTFADAGAYDYHCGIHPSMTGKITVTG